MSNTSALTKLVILSVIIILPIALVVGTRNSSSSTASATVPPSNHAKGGSKFESVIYRASFKGEWPLLRESATLKCWPAGGGDTPAVAVIVEGHDFALTGFSAAYLKQPFLPAAEWLDDDSNPGAKVSLSDLTEAAVALCKNI